MVIINFSCTVSVTLARLVGSNLYNGLAGYHSILISASFLLYLPMS